MDPLTFHPPALALAPIIREGRIIRDLTMPACDWSQFDSPSKDRPRHAMAHPETLQVWGVNKCIRCGAPV